MAKGLSVSVNPDSIMYVSISSSKSGYNSATVVAKMGEEDYMNISYEWKDGPSIPDFAMTLMSFMQNKKMSSGVVPGQETAYTEWSSRKSA